jgi:hypothetical protein
MRAISLVVLVTGISLSMLISIESKAQTPNDGFTMSKGEICLLTDYGQSSWKEYWEGTRLRENLNLGTFTSKMIMPMVGYGLSDKLNLLQVCSVSTSSLQANAGMEGWQDLSVSQTGWYRKKNKGHSTLFSLRIFIPSQIMPDFPY